MTAPNPPADLIKRARAILESDHKRGCEGRSYTCTCGYDLDSDEVIRQSATALEEMVEALEPFANCCEQISDDESDEEWAKFRLLVKDYRKARATIAKVRGGA